MTKKDFVLIADMLIGAYRGAGTDAPDSGLTRNVIDEVVYLMAGELESAFPNFDRMTFINYIDERKWT